MAGRRGPVAVTAERMVHFLSAAVTSRRCGPICVDSDDGGGGRGGDGVVLMIEEEWDNTVLGRDGEGRVDGVVPGHGNFIEVVGVAAAWTQRQRRGRRKFWEADGVQVKILRLWFKDGATGGFIDGLQ
jgi:hypothetical protein